MPVNIGFLGLGQMGAAIAERLEAANIQLHVYDTVTANVEAFVKRGAFAHESSKSVGDAASIVFACLPSPKASLQVATEIATGSAVAVCVELSTIGRPAMEHIASILLPKNIALVDAPVSGGPDGARNGTLAMMAAGDAAALEQVRPHLARIAGSLFEVGHVPGLGQTMKLVNNLIGAATIAVTAEVIVAGAKAGLDPETMVNVINKSSGQSNVTSRLLPAYVLNGGFNFGASMATMLKDVELALAEATALGLPMSATAAAADLWRFGVEQIGGSQDMTRFVQVLEELAEVKLRSSLR